MEPRQPTQRARVGEGPRGTREGTRHTAWRICQVRPNLLQTDRMAPAPYRPHGHTGRAHTRALAVKPEHGEPERDPPSLYFGQSAERESPVAITHHTQTHPTPIGLYTAAARRPSLDLWRSGDSLSLSLLFIQFHLAVCPGQNKQHKGHSVCAHPSLSLSRESTSSRFVVRAALCASLKHTTPPPAAHADAVPPVAVAQTPQAHNSRARRDRPFDGHTPSIQQAIAP